MELAINPSRIISTLCYSVLKVDPYTNCSYSCKYCYARWYRGGELRPRLKALGMFLKVAKKLELRLAFRIATLVEPLQDIEERSRITLKILRIALDHQIPIILSTKSDRISRNPWREVINSMARETLIVVQMSLSSLRNRDLEPKAPDPLKRLEALNSIDAPKVLRLQPLIPNYSFSDAEEFVEFVRDYVDQITVEQLRIERSEIDFYKKFWDRWSYYSFEGDLLRVDAPEILYELKKACEKYGVGFGLCKEGYFNLENVNCCGMHHLDVKIRPTIRELYRELLNKGRIRLDDIDRVFERYLFGEKLEDLPRVIRKALKFHEKVLLKSIRDNNVLTHLTPLMKIEDSHIVLREV